MKLIFALIVALMVNMVIGGKSCVDFGFQCGTTKDQCGNTVDCGSCSGSERCVMNKCVPCTNLCLLQSTTCSTTIKGTIVTPDGVNPVAGMFVYVPNGVLGPKTQGAFCGSGCSDLTGDPLPGVWATTGSDGTFVINDMPSGNIDLVVANLLWRRVFKITVTACTSNDLGKLSLPSTQSEGNIPKIAVVTGNQESFECIFRKIGIKDSEFTVPSDPGSVNLYRMNGASIPGSPTYDALLDNLGLMLTYNIIVISCPGNLYPTTLGQLDNIKEFVNAGGKLFATHYGYSYIKGNPPFDSLAKWTSKSYSGSSCTIPSATPNQLALADYIALLNPTFARNGNDTIIPSVSDLRNDFSEVYSPAEIYMQTTDNNVPIVFGFDTPLTGTSCGKVIFSDFHTDYSSSTAIFPSQCNSVLSIKDQILQYFTFFLAKYSTDPSSCLSKCIPFTCASIGMACGTVTDGCGGTINCSCPGLLRCNCKDNLCEKIPTETLLTMEEKSKKRAAKTYTLTAKSTSELGSDLLTGTITFYDGKVVIGTASVTKGVATIDVNSLNVGFHILSAVYSGDSTFLTSTSNILAFGTGDKGDKGDAGDKGSKGDKGDIGEKGIMGEEGEKGEVGLKGDRGKFGAKGVKGERGLRGKRGRGFSRYDSKKLDDYGKREISLEESVAKKDEEILFLKNKQVEEEKDFEIYKENESKLDAKKDEEISFLVKRQTEDESAMDRFKKEIEELEKIIKR